MAAGVTSLAIGNNDKQATVEIELDTSFALALRISETILVLPSTCSNIVMYTMYTRFLPALPSLPKMRDGDGSLIEGKMDSKGAAASGYCACMFASGEHTGAGEDGGEPEADDRRSQRRSTSRRNGSKPRCPASAGSTRATG